MTAPPAPARFRLIDVIEAGTQGLRTRKVRTMLTALGIAIGIAAMIGVVGISSSSRAELMRQIDQLGTNLLSVRAGQSLFGEQAALPEESPAMIRRIPLVEDASGMTRVEASVRRNHLISPRETGGIGVYAAELDVLDTLEGSLARGRFLDEALANVPAVVLGAVAAERLGIDDLSENPMVFIDGHWFAVVGILEELALHPDLDRSVFIGYDVAEDLFDTPAEPSVVYLRSHPDHVEEVRDILNRTANPMAPNEVDISRPSDALEAKAAVDANLTRLLLALGAVALVVGGVGIANVMVISVMERSSEVGLRRAVGARRSHIAIQFITESAILATLGGLVGVLLGTVITQVYARGQGWLVDIPIEALAAGVVAALVVGALAGLYPAIRAARMDPAAAVHPTG